MTRSTQALAAMILAADAEAQATEASHTVVMTYGGETESVPTEHLARVSHAARICTVYPDGRIDFYHSHLPKEVVPNVP